MQKIKKLMLRNLLVLSCLTVFSSAFSNTNYSSLFSLMEGKEYNQVIISADFDAFKEQKKKGGVHEARLLLRNEQGELEKMTVEISARGKYRLMNCTDMPPIRIKVPTQTLEERGFEKKYQKFKLVTHCVEDNDQAVLKEYWAYKMYQKISANSYRVHLMEVVYHNTASNKREKHLAFMIEDTDEMANRIGGKEKEIWGLAANEMNEKSYQDFILFQHLIGNPDWDIASIRNIKLIYLKGQQKPILVPYDFDYATMVQASYIPQYGKLGSFKAQIESGMGSTAESVNEICQKIDLLDKRSWEFESCAYLSDRSKKEMKSYLNSALNKIVRA